MKNLSLKLWSVLIAVALAYFVRGQGNRSVMSLIVPVELQNLPSEKVVLLPQSPQAQITLRGPSHVLSEVNRTPMSFKVRVPDDVGNRYLTSLQGNRLSLPPSVEILRIDPAEMEFVLDSLVQKKLGVEVPRIGSLQRDYRLEDIIVSPAEVLVTGPETEVEGLQRVNTQQVDLRELTEDTTQELPLRMSGKFLRFQPETVSVDIRVRAITRERRFSEVPVVVTGKNLSKRWMPDPSTVALEISGPRPIIQKMKSDDIVVVVEVPENVERQTEEDLRSLQFQPMVQLPENVELVQITPREVAIKAASAKTRK